jgi:hypothetical protein
MSRSERVPREFAENFAIVAAHYGCSEEEIVEMKVCAKAHIADAAVCFAALRREIEVATVP